MVWAINSHSESENVCTTFLKNNMAVYQNFKYTFSLIQFYFFKYILRNTSTQAQRFVLQDVHCYMFVGAKN